MSRNRRVHAWSIALASGLAFLFAASLNDVVSALTGSSGQAALGAQAQVQPLQQQQQDPPDPAAGRGQGRGGQQAGPRNYTQVITSDVQTDEGIFKVHRTRTDQIYFEIPKAQLGKEFVWNVAIKKTTLGAGFGGQQVTNRVVTWVPKGDRILLLNMDYSVYADPSLPVAMAVADSNYPGIIRTLPVLAYSPTQDPVVDVTALFMTDVAEFSVRGALGAGGIDANRSFLEKTLALPENVNTEVTLTFTGGGGGAAAGGGRGGAGGGRQGMRGPSGTVVVYHSMVKLPDRAMMPRLFDERVGYVTQALVDYGTDQHRSVQRRFIQRFRLEKKDPNAAVSEVVRPIVFHIDPATPKAFVAAVKRGVEEWNSAFEMAGFRNAIQAREAPTNDPEWSAEDARYSFIRWVPSQQENSSYIHDPRSGEILAASVDVYPDVQNFGPHAYFVQAGPLDKRAQTLPLPQEIQSELVRYFTAHQIGHVLGLQHNRKAAAAYTIAQIRDPKFVRTMGHTPTIMDESRFNYVAQPEDGIDPADLIPRVGPYDKWAVRWGYAPAPGATSPDAEKPMLDKWAREQDTQAHLRYSTEGQNNTDFADLSEAVGTSDPVMASTLGLRNLERVSAMLLKATSTKVGEPWSELEAVYNRMVAQWQLEIGHVTRLIGGFETRQTHIGQPGDRFRTVPRERQVAALQFLLQHAFTEPAFMLKPDVLRRIEPAGAVNRVRAAQTAIMASLLQSARLDRMTEQFTLDGAAAYAPLQFLMDLRNGVWAETAKPGTAINLYRRNVQRAYLDSMDDRLNGQPAASAEVRALVKGELRMLEGQLKKAVSAAGLDEGTRRHLQDAVDQIEIILDPTIPRPAPAPDAAAGGGRGRGGLR
jgi:hypothetical protein